MAGVSALAEVFKHVTTKYDNLFEISLPYSKGFHQALADGGMHPSGFAHTHFYPPLLRSATMKKFMVDYEMLGMPQRDITTPEVPDAHPDPLEQQRFYLRYTLIL